MFIVEFYEYQDGDCQIIQWLESLPKNEQAKIYRYIDLLAQYGNRLPYPYSESLMDGIFEIRPQPQRLLYFFVSGKKVIMTHGFTKKSQKTPPREIQKAIELKKDQERRFGK